MRSRNGNGKLMARTADRVRAGVTATLVTAILVAAIIVGSRNLQNFDPALVIYTFATIFATWGVVYHYRVWLDKPPTRVYWERGWQLFRRGGNIPLPIASHQSGDNTSGGTDIYSPPFDIALVDAPAALLGLFAGGCDYIPAGVRVDIVSIAADGSGDVCRTTLWLPHANFSSPYA